MSGPETAEQVAARIDAVWDFDDPAASETAFRGLLEEAGDAPDPELDLQIRTQIARCLGLQRRFDEAHAVLDGVEARLGSDRPLAKVRYLLERGRVFNSSGRREDAGPCFLSAWEQAKTLGSDFYAVDAAHMMAIVEPPEAALHWNERALEMVRRSRDVRARGWMGSLCNNIGWAHHAAGRYEDALAMFEQARKARERQGRARDIRVARWCVARCLRSLGRIGEALKMQRSLLLESEAAGDPAGFEHEEIAECLLALGREDEARPHFAKAWEVLSADPWIAEGEPERLERLAHLGRPVPQ